MTIVELNAAEAMTVVGGAAAEPATPRQVLRQKIAAIEAILVKDVKAIAAILCSRTVKTAVPAEQLSNG